METLPFWRDLFRYTDLGNGNLGDPTGRQANLNIRGIPADSILQHEFRVDVSLPRSIVRQRVAAAVAAGGRITDDARAPDRWILTDPAGNRVKVSSSLSS
ncbi:VOC family protein [Agromyces larvae]|uniref:VOC family protein n=1 Tax=Agromyces larvae TaxID=2929802 RepID=UPI00338FB2CA